jgi:hypothetical protein
MWKFLSVFDSLLSEHSREMLTHESIKICIALTGLEVLTSEQSKGNYNLKKTLLIVDTILQTVKSSYPLQQITSGILTEVFLI